MGKFMPQEIIRIKDFLNEVEVNDINPCVESQIGREITSLVFSILRKRLDQEFEQADKEMAAANG